MPKQSFFNLICTMRTMLEDSNERRPHLYILFMDFEKAFDSVGRQTLWKALQFYGIPQKLICPTGDIYEETNCCDKISDGSTHSFKMIFGVRRGFILSPLLCIRVVGYIIRKINGYGIWIAIKLLQDVDFADCVGFIKADKQKLQEFLEKLVEKAEQYGLHIKAPKTKAMSISSSPIGS